MDSVDSVLEPVRVFTTQFINYLPILAIAFVILIVGWLVAKMLKSVVSRGLRIAKFQKLSDHAGIDTFMERGGIKLSASDLIAVLIYWVVILMTLLLASNVLGLTVVADLFVKILNFTPKVFAAILILTIGSYFALFFSELLIAYAKNIGFDEAEIFGRIARYAIVAFVVIIALGQMDIGTTILVPAFLIFFGGVMLAFAIAFGLGGRDWAARQFDKLSRNRDNRP